jgi:hypothetical protein
MNQSRVNNRPAAIDLYLELMKACLSDLIFIDHPLAYALPFDEKKRRRFPKNAFFALLIPFLARYRIKLVENYSAPWLGDVSASPLDQRRALRESGQEWPARAHTMIGMKRLDNLQYCVQTAIEEGISGDFIETGTWRGGASIFMRAVAKAYDDRTRIIWVADSFEGLPPPNPGEFPADEGDTLHTFRELAVSLEEVRANFERYGLLDEQVRFLKGWFKDTLPTAPIDRLAVARLDGDMYESTIQALDALYHKVSPGGFLIIDDYHLANCRSAVHDFRTDHKITSPIHDIDGRGAFWRKID